MTILWVIINPILKIRSWSFGKLSALRETHIQQGSRTEFNINSVQITFSRQLLKNKQTKNKNTRSHNPINSFVTLAKSPNLYVLSFPICKIRKSLPWTLLRIKWVNVSKDLKQLLASSKHFITQCHYYYCYIYYMQDLKEAKMRLENF